MTFYGGLGGGLLFRINGGVHDEAAVDVTTVAFDEVTSHPFGRVRCMKIDIAMVNVGGNRRDDGGSVLSFAYNLIIEHSS